MEIKPLNFEKKEIQIIETYLDEDGKTRDRVKTVLVSTGKVIPEGAALPAPSGETQKDPE